jgi:transcriptional regulator with XRE-family HTH domain
MVEGLTNRLREWRKRRSFTLETAAGRLGVNPTTLARYESNELPITTVTLVGLAELYQCHPIELISDVDGWAVSPPGKILIGEAKALDERGQAALVAVAKTIAHPKVT